MIVIGGYEDTKTEDLSQECFVITQDYKDYIDEQEEEQKKIPIDPMAIF